MERGEDLNKALERAYEIKEALRFYWLPDILGFKYKIGKNKNHIVEKVHSLENLLDKLQKETGLEYTPSNLSLLNYLKEYPYFYKINAVISLGATAQVLYFLHNTEKYLSKVNKEDKTK